MLKGDFMRINKLIDLIDDKTVFYLTDSADMRYYSGFTGEGAVIIGKSERMILTDGRYTEKATLESDFEVVNSLNHTEILQNIGKSVVLQPESITYVKVLRFLNNGINILKTEFDFEELRSRKDDYEIDCLKKAAEIAEKSLEEILPFVKAGVKEKELSAKLDYLMLLNGGEKSSFDTIFISGKNTSMPHGVPTENKIKEGDFVTVDFGCVYKGYCSDMTRTFAVSYATDEMKNVYETVKEAQINAQNSIKSGVCAKDIDKIARDYITDKGYGEYFVHSTGHGVGLKIHEKPNLSARTEILLKENHIVTVEPGIYIPGKFGVRIENTVVVKENFAESLQKFQKELIIL